MIPLFCNAVWYYHSVDYELIKSRRKTIAIHIRDCRVIVRAPVRASAREVDRFVELKRGWIEKHLAAQKENEAKRAAYKLDYGARVLYLGREYSIASGCGQNILYFPQGFDESQLRKKLIEFYKDQACKYLAERVEYFAPLVGARPANIRIGSARHCWGSCSAKGRVTFSWRLMMAHPDAIDYVVVHELAHLKQLNHSTDFWAIVSHVIPDWKDRRKTLRMLQKHHIT